MINFFVDNLMTHLIHFIVFDWMAAQEVLTGNSPKSNHTHLEYSMKPKKNVKTIKCKRTKKRRPNLPIERERKINNDQLADQMKNGSYQPKYHITFLNIEERKKKRSALSLSFIRFFFLLSNGTR